MSNKPLVEISDVTVRLDNRLVLDSVSMELFPRVIVGLIGPNGAGKTTLLEVILGKIKPKSGKVLLGGKKPEKALKDGFGLGYLPQKHNFNRELPVTSLEVILMARYARMGFLKSPGKEDIEKAREILDLVNSSELENRLVKELSGGQLQRVLIARALVNDPKLILLDEPEAGVDIETSAKFMDLMAMLRDNLDISIVLVSHDIGTITKHADKVACLNKKLYFHDCCEELCPEALKHTYGENSELLVHNLPVRFLEKHND